MFLFIFFSTVSVGRTIANIKKCHVSGKSVSFTQETDLTCKFLFYITSKEVRSNAIKGNGQ